MQYKVQYGRQQTYYTSKLGPCPRGFLLVLIIIFGLFILLRVFCGSICRRSVVLADSILRVRKIVPNGLQNPLILRGFG
jgi:hypothetical protein